MELVYFLIVLIMVPNIRNTLDTKNRHPEWDKILLYTRWFAIGLFVITIPKFFDHTVMSVIWHVFMILCVWVVYTRKEFQYVRSLFISTLPLIGLGIIEIVGSLIFPKLYDSYDSYVDIIRFVAILWVITIWFQNRKQAKILTEERLKHEEEEERYQQSLARKAELELLVAQRTSELTRQKEELETALNHLKTTQTQLVQSEKMASLGELTAGIAHEIQNPLNFVNNFAEVNSELIEELREVQEKPEVDQSLIDDILHDLADNMQKMLHHGKRADSIVKGMLMHSRSTSGEKERVDINALADEYMRLAYHGLRAKDKSFNASLEIEFGQEKLWAKVIPQDFGRVLLNIFNNAFYAVMDKGRTENEDFRPTVWLGTRLIENEVEIRIRDNGSGIPDSVRERIFEPFFTTKPTGQGTGLGLSISYDIVTKAHGGTLEVESKKGAFTEFRIRIPHDITSQEGA